MDTGISEAEKEVRNVSSHLWMKFILNCSPDFPKHIIDGYKASRINLMKEAAKRTSNTGRTDGGASREGTHRNINRQVSSRDVNN